MLVILFLFGSSSVGRAADGESSATADALFREGRAALVRGDYAEAAAKLAESANVEPTPGTLLNLALAEEKLGRLAVAWEHARATLDQLPSNDARQSVARELFDRLDQRLPRLALILHGPAPAGLRIERNGIMLGAGGLGSALPVEPGKHRILVQAQDRADAVYTVTIEEGARETLRIEPGAVRVPVAPTRTSNSPLRTAGWAALIGGTTGLAASAVLGLFVLDRKSIVDAACDPSGCSDRGFAAANEGKAFSTASTISVIAGVGLVVAGVVMIALAPPSNRMGTRSPLAFGIRSLAGTP